MATRRPNGDSSIYQDKDGKWHGRVTVGIKDDGTPDRRHVRGKNRAEVTKKVRELEKKRDEGNVPKAGKKWTVASWLTHWVENIAALKVRPNTLAGYRVAVNVHLIPGVGGHRLEKLEPEHLERLYKKMQDNGSKPATAHQAHRTIRAALNQAVKRGHITRNVASIATAPTVDEEEVTPYEVEEVQQLLHEAGKRRNSARWAVALALGLRQGEALGLHWSDIDLDEGTLWVRQSMQRPKYRHGCDPFCEKKHAGRCPDRVRTNKQVAPTKSKAGKRLIGLPDQLIKLLRLHQEEQQRERLAARQLWNEGDWVFATETGQPLIPRTDWDEWKRLLQAAGLRDGRLHDARHTAGTILLILGVPERIVMEVMGWSSSAMAQRYQHVTKRVRRDVAKQIGGLIWEAAKDPAEGGPDSGPTAAEEGPDRAN
ncbi:tyrosine-type recombinase/integrase [Kitasatospora acidiphila]|uniref:tyrosine-type recombinase/integrase n=1 Tax=Kitasatospora acidiphila TaxID=2567942 RepID=UPI003C76F03B